MAAKLTLLEEDWILALPRGLVFANMPKWGARNLVRNAEPTNSTGEYRRTAGPCGMYLYPNGDTGIEYQVNNLYPATPGMTLFSVWRAGSEYFFVDGLRTLLSSRNSSNQGWSWGRAGAVSGGSQGNRTGQSLTIHGVSVYYEANSTIDSFVDTPVAVRIDGTTVSWFSNGRKSSGDTTIAASSQGDKLNFLDSGPFGINNGRWLDKSIITLIFDRALSDSEIIDLSSKKRWFYEPDQIPLFKPVVTAQFSRPVSDISAGAWTASTGSDLFAMLDETSANDSDYITTTSASTCEVALGTLNDPAASTGHVLRYRISATGGGIIVRLLEGSTTIASWTHNPAPSSPTTYAQTLAGGEADSISDYTALKLQFEATS